MPPKRKNKVSLNASDSPKSIESLMAKYAGMGGKLGSDPSLAPEFIPTGISVLDRILGGGIPRNRIMQILGDWGVGKTFLMQKAIAHAQSMGLMVGYIDSEQKMDPDWVMTTGVNIGNLLVFQNNLGEEVLNLTIQLVKDLDMLIIDSVPALVPMEEVAKDMKDDRVASHARMMKKFIIRCLPHLNKSRGSHCALVMINHITEGIGGYIPVVNYPGGRALKYYSSLIVRLSRKGWATAPSTFAGKEDIKRIGFDIICKTEKNSLTSPYQKCLIPFSFDGTIDPARALGRAAMDEGIIKQSGSYYAYKDVSVQGKGALYAILRSRKDLQESLEEELLSVGNSGVDHEEVLLSSEETEVPEDPAAEGTKEEENGQ